MPTLADLETKYFPLLPTSPPHSGDTEVIAHIDGEAYFRSLAAAINATTGVGDVIYMVNWYFDEDVKLLDPAPPSIKDLLAQKAAAGVDVKIVLWTGRNQLPDSAVDISDIGWWTGKAYADFKNVVDRNIVAALTLRTHRTSPGVRPPLEDSVLMDWSGNLVGSRHQKYAVVYSKSRQEMRAFVGGIDINEDRQTTPDHPDKDHKWHDAGVELVGEAARAVWVDFTIRWNETRSLKHLQYIMLGKGKQYFNLGLFLPVFGPGRAVTASITPTTKSVRIVRTYGEEKDSWDSIPWDTTPPGGGLQEIFAVYQKAINSATRYIYVEDQALNNSDASTSTPHSLLYPLVHDAALLRGVKVIFVCPGDSGNTEWVGSLARELHPQSGYPLPQTISRNFSIFRVDDVYIHSKVVLIDDEFAAVGSANFYDRSMVSDDTELTAAIVDTGSFVKDLRVRLWAEHLRVDPNDPLVKSELEDLTKSLGIFDPTWGTGGITFVHPRSRLTPLTVPTGVYRV